MLSLLTVAALTPSEVEVTLVDEQVQQVPWDQPFDLVGITCMTALAPRAYELAARFRQRGIPVVLGGMHPTACPDEALQHADAVVAGDAEEVWRAVIEDTRRRRVKGIYRSKCAPALGGLPPLPRQLMAGHRYATVHAVQATRGCPHQCDFCSVSAYHGHQQRQRPVDEVLEEIRTIPDRFFIFVDDNLTADVEYARRLFTGLVGLGKHWVTQTTLSLARDEAMLRLAADAGCVGVFVGLETFTSANLDAVHKDCHRVADYREAIRQFHAHGIGVEAGIVFGMPGDRPDSFATTLWLLDDWEVDAVQISIFTPLPGTPRFRAVEASLLDRHWAHYDFHHVVFQPSGLSVEALQAGHDWTTREFYRPWRIARRILRHLRRPRFWAALPFLTAVNLAYYGRVVRWHIRGWDPSQEQVALQLPDLPEVTKAPATRPASAELELAHQR
jgi:radical SAM superfamily enzyme YgiQ (UPF0313 family)